MKLKVLAGMLVATAAMAMGPIEELNKAVVELLKPINNNLTIAEMEFTSLETNDVRALKAGVSVEYLKQGKLTDLLFSIPELSYDYNGTNGPLISFNILAETELLEIIEQDMINELGPVVSEIMTDLATDFLEEYGQAAEVEVTTVEEKYDSDGNLINIIVSGSLNVNLSKLPAGFPVEEVPVLNTNVRLAAGLRGMSIQGTVTMNRDFKAFDEDNVGLKEMIEKLLAQDKSTMLEIQDLMMGIDGLVGEAVNKGFKDNRLDNW